MEIVNRNGVVVDLAALDSSVDPYGPELNRRTIGLTMEEELLTFFRELKGQWGSRRKKRKVVDACDLELNENEKRIWNIKATNAMNAYKMELQEYINESEEVVEIDE
ncbi:hypothetical protein FRX31_014379 [Thalictrum thalictroides]|uniref:Uncharacterized protein n=1 Tax=Thalictrum thalictroides TaxID=46969 RepID=A0A7J6WGE1_THATH|nr:hypothetical protein FRX31_014379 [Thalictrum thalictroides]